MQLQLSGNKNQYSSFSPNNSAFGDFKSFPKNNHIQNNQE